MKIAPIIRAFNESGKFQTLLVHTGQHYDAKMSHLFFDELNIPKPDVKLEVGSGLHAVQTAEVMKRFEPVVLDFKPDYVLVVGDVNSTIACGLVAVKLGVQAYSRRGYPAKIRMGNGPELTSAKMADWTEEHGVAL